jgi:diguanylate cyclase (GGDEF)-like protein/PAS domain S-box-containing protein
VSLPGPADAALVSADGRDDARRGAASLSLGAKLSRVLGAADAATLGSAIEECLELLGTFARVDVATVTLIDDYGLIVDDWHWVGAGHVAAAPRPGTPMGEVFGSATAFLELGRGVALDDVADVELAPSERALADANGLRGILLAPVMAGTRLLGVTSLQTLHRPARWPAGALEQMDVLARLLVQAIYRVRDRDQLALANARARRIAEYVSDGLLMLDLAGTVHWSSRSFTKMSGLATGAVDGRPLARLFDRDDTARVRLALHEAGRDGDARVTARMLTVDGGSRWVDLSLHLASDADPSVPDEIIGSVHDCHEQYLREAQLLEQRDIDALTGVANRAGLEHAVAALGEAGIVVAFCDLDDFKTINDTLGHEAGDRALRGVAGALREAAGPEALVGRLGGDEFAVVCVESPVSAEELGHAVVAAVAALGSPTVSVGVAGPGPASGFADLRRAADQAMYRAKRSGKNTATT